MAVRMAHIQLPEDLGIEDAILPGDPARVDRVAALLEQPEELMFNREYKSVRGRRLCTVHQGDATVRAWAKAVTMPMP